MQHEVYSMEKITSICRDKLNLAISDEMLENFQTVVAELLKWNKKINLTSIRKPQEIMIKHILDSLYLIPSLPDNINILDIGSGGGFPALIIALCKRSCRIVSVDAVAKKIHFQRNVARLLKLDNLDAKHCRVEEMIKEFSGSFDVITSRAFSSIETFTNFATPLLADDGVMIAMKGRGGIDETEVASDFLKNKNLQIQKIIDYDLPDNLGNRKLIFIEKR